MGEGTDLQGGRLLHLLCLSFLIYKMGLKSPNMVNWQGDYISEIMKEPSMRLSR